ncbi:MAG: hypothetical protein EBZ59_10615 [Planctomycetia bacterium]|nr:hypothetical protein [Planctomycetia bacterium]
MLTCSKGIIRTGTVLRVAGGLLTASVLALAASAGFAREGAGTSAVGSSVGFSSPGAIGALPRLQPGPCPERTLPDPVQPVEIRGPEGMLVSIETAAGWSPLRKAPLRMGLVVGHAYRLRVAGIPGHDGQEVFPTVRVLARLETPPGMAWRFPVEILIDADDLVSAVAGAHVRRVVYASCESDQPDVVPAGWFDVKPGADCLDVAATLGDPVAEVILGNRVPSTGAVP